MSQVPFIIKESIQAKNLPNYHLKMYKIHVFSVIKIRKLITRLASVLTRHLNKSTIQFYLIINYQ